MDSLGINDVNTLRRELVGRFRNCANSRLVVRICCVLCVASGCGCRDAAQRFGVSKRAVELWVRRYSRQGMAGLREKSRVVLGARKLSIRQWKNIENDLFRSPAEFGYSGAAQWSGTTLSDRLSRTYGVSLSARQCRRMLRDLRQRHQSMRKN